MTPSTLREFRRLCNRAIRRASAGYDTAAAEALRDAALCLSARALAEGGTSIAALSESRRALLDRCAEMGSAWSAAELAMVLQCGEAEAEAIIGSGWPRREVPRG